MERFKSNPEGTPKKSLLENVREQKIPLREALRRARENGAEPDVIADLEQAVIDNDSAEGYLEEKGER